MDNQQVSLYKEETSTIISAMRVELKWEEMHYILIKMLIWSERVYGATIISNRNTLTSTYLYYLVKARDLKLKRFGIRLTTLYLTYLDHD